ncbi:hypothetical protein WICPIJ_000513 [Wickerhamomyces pijperi]|uniref:Uncharacterized protein n=1 Tax=Wickerhamomyces pijperi TaxID=599730 RepID=A0A9P8QCQ3_WICPI|nr:hypothetical protein WICPIJ_000513 [Wickerhamomyces pijperi]
MTQDSLGGDSAGRINGQHLTNQILRFWGDLIQTWHFERTALNLQQQVSYVLVIEWQSTSKQGEENHTTGPDIRFKPMVRQPGDNFRSCVMWRATRSFQQTVIVFQGSHPEIGNLDVQIMIQKQVFRLQITVADT